MVLYFYVDKSVGIVGKKDVTVRTALEILSEVNAHCRTNGGGVLMYLAKILKMQVNAQKFTLKLSFTS